MRIGALDDPSVCANADILDVYRAPFNIPGARILSKRIAVRKKRGANEPGDLRRMPELTFLGTGTSNGIPMIGCECPVCRSSDPRDRRSRTSSVVRWGETVYLIDTATELRTQALERGLKRIDAVLMTHAHADHTGGFDDLRRFNQLIEARLPVYAGAATAGMLRERYAYAFTHEFPFYGGKPDVDLIEVDPPFTFGDQTIVPIPVWHGRTQVHGFRFDDLAYLTDVKTIPDTSMDLLRGVDTLVINALRERPHPTHLSIEDALQVIAELKPRQAFLVHLSHEISHAEATALLPPGVQVAWDGLEIASATGR
jgi:phosphoribosyl 1,2-cyclic phosphate phosphodiesterase